LARAPVSYSSEQSARNALACECGRFALAASPDLAACVATFVAARWGVQVPPA